MRTTSQADLAVRLRLAVARTARRLRQEAGEELSPSQTAALATIDRHGPLTPCELADRERIRRPTATRLIAGLEEARLVERTADPLDRPLVPLSADARRPRAARPRAHPQERLSGPPPARAVARRARDARPRRRHPRAPARGGRARVTQHSAAQSTRWSVPNYRRYFAGQVVSISGNWMQMVAEMWLIVKLTGSGVSRRPHRRPAVPADPALRRLGRPARRPPAQAPRC